MLYGKLTYNTRSEEGKVKLPDGFPRDIIEMDLLRDWIYELQKMYDSYFEREKNV